MANKNNPSHAKARVRKKKKHGRIIGLICAVAVVCAVLAVVLLTRGGSAYRRLANEGYRGTQEQLIASLVGELLGGEDEKSAYELAVERGFSGSIRKWNKILAKTDTDSTLSPFVLACDNGCTDSLAQWLGKLVPEAEALGHSKESGKKTEYELACEYGFQGSFIEWIISISQDRVFE